MSILLLFFNRVISLSRCSIFSGTHNISDQCLGIYSGGVISLMDSFLKSYVTPVDLNTIHGRTPRILQHLVYLHRNGSHVVAPMARIYRFIRFCQLLLLSLSLRKIPVLRFHQVNYKQHP